MRCEHAHLLLSAALDGEATAAEAEAVAGHVATCPACASYDADLLTLRRRFRLVPLGDVPDVTWRVLRSLDSDSEPAPVTPRHQRRWWQPAAAAFVAGALVGALLMGLGRDHPDEVVAADLGQRVLQAQTEVTSVDASVTITERGWNPAVPVRHFDGTLRYRAPESLALMFTDRTSYPSKAWVANDTSVVIDRDRSWSQGPPACPVTRQPECEPSLPQRLAVEERHPFSDDGEALNLVVPVASFSVPGSRTELPVRTIAGRSALGITVTVAQLRPVLSALQAAGNWRELYDADRAEVWLDQASMVPLAITVRASGGVDRDRWAAARAYRDPPGDVELELEVGTIAINRALPADAFSAAPPGSVTRLAGFVDQPVSDHDVPTPGFVPAGFRPSRTGVQTGGGPAAGVRTWTDGRSWFEVTATHAWMGPGLFGDLGSDIRVRTSGGGVAYVNAGGDRVAIHGRGVDALVRGTTGEDVLVQVASSLGITPAAIPADWAEAGATSLADAVAVRPHLLVPHGVQGFGAPAISVAGSTVTLAYDGPGGQTVRLVEADGDRLAPPLDPDARGVLVRGVAGRYQPLLHELEWVEQSQLVTLHSPTLTAAELLSIATSLGAP